VSSSERITRPTPRRTGPIRSWTALFGAETATHPNGDATAGASFERVVSRSVDVGYRVVDDYIRHAQQVAGRLGDRSYGPGTMVEDFQHITARMTRHASDLMEIWFQMIELAAGGGLRAGVRPAAAAAAPVGHVPAPPPSPAAPAPEAAAGARMTVELASSQPAAASLDLRPGAVGAPLIVHALRAAEPDKPRLTDIELRPATDDEPLVLQVRVPADHPPGIYNGLIIDARTSRPVGTISVRVGNGE